jgi:uncharacterized protein (TIGR01777 family)
MKLILPGGGGHLGTMLAKAFHAEGHEVVVLSRKPAAASWRVLEWDAVSPGAWTSELEGADVVINLTGRSVNCRYTPENRRLIKESRVLSTRLVGRVIAAAKQPPKIWLQPSTATIYAHRFDAPNDEKTGLLESVSDPNLPDTWRFSIDVANSWEAAANEIATPRTRKVFLRISIVMSPDRGSAFDVLLRLVRYGLGGTVGSGHQYVSWIHDQDFVRAIRWIIEDNSIEGPVNLAAPNPIQNADFMAALRRAWGIPLGMPASAWMLEIGSFFLRAESELVLKSRRVIPGRLMERGFAFEFPTWPEAAADLCKRWRAGEA